LSVHDTNPDPVAAWRAAVAERPDVLLGPYGSGPTRAVAEIADRLWWNHGGAAPAAGHAPRIDVLAAAGGYFDGVLEVLARSPLAPRTTLLAHGSSGFATAVAAEAARSGARLGLRCRRVTVAADRVPELPAADLLLVVGDFATEVAVAERVLGPVPAAPGQWALRASWSAAGMVSAGTAEVLERFGRRREGLLGPAQWLAAAAPPQPELGPSAAEFVVAYRARTGGEPAYPAAQAFAAGLLAAECVARAGSVADSAVLAVAQSLDVSTLFGRFRLEPETGRQIGHRLVTVQWQDGRRVPVWPPGPGCEPLRLPPGLSAGGGPRRPG
jgi:branched-chain amino acid transport system substrate-binding protein